MNLKVNEKKTKFIIVKGTAVAKVQKKKIYNNIAKRREEREVVILSRKEWRKLNVQCSICGKSMKEVSLQRHMINKHNINPNEKYEE